MHRRLGSPYPRVFPSTAVNCAFDVRVRARRAHPAHQEPARDASFRRIRARRFVTGQRGLLRQRERHNAAAKA